MHTHFKKLKRRRCFDWLLKLRIPVAIHLLATRVGFAPENIVIVTRTNEVKSPFSAINIIRLFCTF